MVERKPKDLACLGARFSNLQGDYQSGKNDNDRPDSLEGAAEESFVSWTAKAVSRFAPPQSKTGPRPSDDCAKSNDLRAMNATDY